jgi:DNA helicase-2/ATP-dependent DNA helicase PcrA
LLTDADNEKEEDRDKVTIMTAHAAKGLEYRFVYVTGLEEELFPSRMSSNTREELEEERRLFYVALTRAMEQVTLSYAITRYRWGVPINSVPSRFIREIETAYLDQPIEEARDEPYQPGWKPSRKKVESVPVTTEKIKRMKPVSRGAAPVAPSGGFPADNPEEIQVGMPVEHPRFGPGKIISMEGELPNRKATVFFQAHGQKQLLLKFAKLKIIR